MTTTVIYIDTKTTPDPVYGQRETITARTHTGHDASCMLPAPYAGEVWVDAGRERARNARFAEMLAAMLLRGWRTTYATIEPSPYAVMEKED